MRVVGVGELVLAPVGLSGDVSFSLRAAKISDLLTRQGKSLYVQWGTGTGLARADYSGESSLSPSLALFFLPFK